MTDFTYTRKDLDTEARCSVRDFRRQLPAAIRRTVKAHPGEWALRVHADRDPVLLAYFTDENGRHEINIAL
jgi:hypothetical protein